MAIVGLVKQCCKGIGGQLCCRFIGVKTCKGYVKGWGGIAVGGISTHCYAFIFDMVLAIDFVTLSISLMAKSMASSIKASTFGFL